MSKACKYIHDFFSHEERFQNILLEKEMPSNGVYILFERTEKAHGGDRIVRVGTHNGQDRLIKRLCEHLYTENKDRSIFRKHIGRSLLNREKDDFIKQWEICLTSKAQREKHAHLIDMKKQLLVEQQVSKYIKENFSFALFPVEDKQKRLRMESLLLSTVASCSECNSSERWLGRSHPNKTICGSGLWNIQGLKGEALELGEAREIFGEF